MVDIGASEGQRNEAQAISRRWRIHLVILLAWVGLVFRAADITRSAAVERATIGVVFLGLSGLSYGLVTTAAM